MDSKPLSLKVKLGFGLCDVGGNLFVTDVTLLGAGLAGTALLVGKIWDASIDPAIGFLSDRMVLNAYRMSFAVVGTFIGAGLVLPLVGAFAGRTWAGRSWPPSSAR